MVGLPVEQESGLAGEWTGMRVSRLASRLMDRMSNERAKEQMEGGCKGKIR